MNQGPDALSESGAEASRAADARARREAQSVFELPFVLEAGAGTGKTTALIARIISWIMGPGWEKHRARLAKESSAPSEDEDLAASVLDGVVAITFTEAAAAEMETRTGQVLAILARGETQDFLAPDESCAQGESRARRAECLLTNLDHLQVHTIHAWCSRILARFPLEAGLHPDFQVDADGTFRREAAQEIVEEYLHSAYLQDLNPALSALARDGKGPNDLASALTALVELDVRSEELQSPPFAQRELQIFNAKVLEILGQLPKDLVLALGKIPRNKNSGCFSRWMTATTAALNTEPPQSRAELERFLDKALDEDLKGTKTKLSQWKSGTFNKGEMERVGDSERSLLRKAAPSLLELVAGLEKLRPQLLEAALETLAPLLGAVEKRLHAQGVLSYEDLLSRTRDLLRASPQVGALLRREIDQILVDEFQDTNDLQCEIIHRLALRGDAAERPGLFLVGDPKQSVYGWRGADLSAYDRFVSQLEELGIPRRRLSVNFRSVPQILDEVNRTIAPIMQAEKELQPPYQYLLPSPSNEGRTGYRSVERRPIEHWVSSLPRNLQEESLGSGEMSALEARALASDLSALAREVGPSFCWSSVGLLFRSGGDLELYLAELRRARIPYSVERDRHYFRRREILDATALVAAVVEPADHLSLLTFLRSGWVGVPDAALLGLWRRNFPHEMSCLKSPDETAIEKLTQIINETAGELAPTSSAVARIGAWEECLCLAVRQLASLRESLRVDRPEIFLKNLRRWTQAEARDGARYLGLYRVANLERFFRQLRDALCSGRDDARSYLVKLRRQMQEEAQTQEAKLQVGASDAVRVMSIHKAKGLDFEHVYLLQCHKNPRPSHAIWKGTRVPQPRHHSELLLMDYPNLSYALFANASERVGSFERIRLLYVALTRAKQRLVVAGGRDASLDPPYENARNFAELLSPRARAAGFLEQVENALSEESSSFVEEIEGGEVLWRLLPNADLPQQATPEAEAAPRALTLEQILRDGERLAQLRQGAKERRARPYHRAASSLELDSGPAQPAEEAPLAAPSPEAGDARAAAKAAGSAIHAALQHYAFSLSEEDAFEDMRSTAEATLPRLVAPEQLDEARALCASILDCLHGSELLHRLRGLEKLVLGREVPILTSAPLDHTPAPLGFCPGFVDLLYRDPTTGEVVVADYKTDRLQGPLQLKQRARHYEQQGRIYCRALKETLGPEQGVRFELWFLRYDQIERIS